MGKSFQDKNELQTYKNPNRKQIWGFYKAFYELSSDNLSNKAPLSPRKQQPVWVSTPQF